MENIFVTSYFKRLAAFFCIPTGEPEFWNHLPISLANIQNCIHLQKQFDISILIIFTIYAYNMLLTCTIYIDLYPPNWYYNLIEFLSKKKTKSKIHSSDFSGRWDWKKVVHTWQQHHFSSIHRRSKISIDRLFCAHLSTWTLEMAHFLTPRKMAKKTKKQFFCTCKVRASFRKNKKQVFLAKDILLRCTPIWSGNSRQ